MGKYREEERERARTEYFETLLERIRDHVGRRKPGYEDALAAVDVLGERLEKLEKVMIAIYERAVEDEGAATGLEDVVTQRELEALHEVASLGVGSGDESGSSESERRYSGRGGLLDALDDLELASERVRGIDEDREAAIRARADARRRILDWASRLVDAFGRLSDAACAGRSVYPCPRCEHSMLEGEMECMKCGHPSSLEERRGVLVARVWREIPADRRDFAEPVFVVLDGAGPGATFVDFETWDGRSVKIPRHPDESDGHDRVGPLFRLGAGRDREEDDGEDR